MSGPADAYLRELNSTLTKVVENMGELQGRMKGLDGHMNGIENRMGVLQDGIDSCRSEFKKDIGDLHSKIDDKIGEIRGRLDPISRSYSKLSSSGEHTVKDLEALEKKVHDIEDASVSGIKEKAKQLSNKSWMLFIIALSTLLSGCISTVSGICVYYATKADVEKTDDQSKNTKENKNSHNTELGVDSYVDPDIDTKKIVKDP